MGPEQRAGQASEKHTGYTDPLVKAKMIQFFGKNTPFSFPAGGREPVYYRGTGQTAGAAGAFCVHLWRI